MMAVSVERSMSDHRYITDVLCLGVDPWTKNPRWHGLSMDYTMKHT